MRNKNFSGKLFIAGGGRAADSFLLDFEFVRSLKSGKILYIPIGLQRNLIGYEECHDWIIKTLTPHGQKLKKKLDIEMWVNLAKKNFSDIEEFDALYIGGAQNSFRLMKKFQETGFMNLIYEFLNMGRTIYGGSTGAIILGKYISVFDESPVDDLQEDIGLELLGNYSIFCHYKLAPTEKLNKFLENKKMPVIALTEKSGLMAYRGRACAVGSENVFLFKGDSRQYYKIVKPNERFSICEYGR